MPKKSSIPPSAPDEMSRRLMGGKPTPNGKIPPPTKDELSKRLPVDMWQAKPMGKNAKIYAKKSSWDNSNTVAIMVSDLSLLALALNNLKEVQQTLKDKGKKDLLLNDVEELMDTFFINIAK